MSLPPQTIRPQSERLTHSSHHHIYVHHGRLHPFQSSTHTGHCLFYVRVLSNRVRLYCVRYHTPRYPIYYCTHTGGILFFLLYDITEVVYCSVIRLLYAVYHSETQQSYSPAVPGRDKGWMGTIEQVKQVSTFAVYAACCCLEVSRQKHRRNRVVPASPFDKLRAHQRPDADGCIWIVERQLNFPAIRIAGRSFCNAALLIAVPT